jgi:hypothetical protein
MYVAKNAPTIPRIVVRIKPDGSFFPGVMNFAITPAMNPMMIVQMMLMAIFLILHDGRLVYQQLRIGQGQALWG